MAYYDTPRRTVLKALAAGSALPAVGSTATASRGDDEEGECPIPSCIHPVLGYPGLSSDAHLPEPLKPDHEVQLSIQPREEAEIPEFFFDPVGLHVERGDVVRFELATPDHTVTAYHPGFGRQRRVPDDVPPFSSPVLAGGTFWLYRFDEPGVYDLLCAPHEIFGMVMRIVVDEPAKDFGDVGEGLRPPALTAALVLDDPALDPENVVDEGSVGWSDLSAESKRPLVEFVEPTTVETVASFDPPDLPENVAIDRDGTVYLSMAATGEIRELAPDGEQSTVAELALGGDDDVEALTGVAVDAEGTLYAALASFDSDTHGVWRIEAEDSAERLASMATDTFPNGVLVTHDSVLVSDSAGGAVWEVTDDGVDEWLTSDLLEPDSEAELPIGANGLAVGRDGALYVANTDFGRVVRVAITADGSAGETATYAEDEELVGADGIAFDSRGDLYVAVNRRNTVVRVGHDGTIETLATADDGLDFPSDVHFGTTRETSTELFVTNFAFESVSAGSETANPSLVKLDVGVPGLPDIC